MTWNFCYEYFDLNYNLIFFKYWAYWLILICNYLSYSLVFDKDQNVVQIICKTTRATKILYHCFMDLCLQRTGKSFKTEKKTSHAFCTSWKSKDLLISPQCVVRKFSFCLMINSIYMVLHMVFLGNNTRWSYRYAIGSCICLHDLSTLGTITSHNGAFVWTSNTLFQSLLLFHWTFISFHCFKFWYQLLLILCIRIKVSSRFSKYFWLQTRCRKYNEDSFYHFYKHVVFSVKLS